MAVRPTDVLEDISLETVDLIDGIFIPLTSLPGLTSAEADPVTGDGREVLRVILQTATTNLSIMPAPPTGMYFTTYEPTKNGQKQQDFSFLFDVNVPANSYSLPAQE